MTDAVTESRPRDPTGAARQARFRERRRRLTVTAEQATVTPNQRNGPTMITTVEMCALAGRLTSDNVTEADLQLAGRLILMLVRRLPADASLDVTMQSTIPDKEPRIAQRTAAAGARPGARRRRRRRLESSKTDSRRR